MRSPSQDLNSYHSPSSCNAAPQAPVRARQTGLYAALGMGISASLILLLAFFLNTQPTEAPVVAETTSAPVTLFSKYTTKATMAETEAVAMAPMKPFAAFDLSLAGFEQEKKTIASHMNSDDNGRVDSLTIGQFAMGAPFAHIDIHQGLSEKETAPDFFLDMSRHAAQLGLNVTRISQPGVHQTRLGAFEIADIRLIQPAGNGLGESDRACFAARHADSKRNLEIAGIICQPSAERPLARSNLACALDRLDYRPTGEDADFRNFFEKAEAPLSSLCANTISHDDITASIPRRKSRAGAR